MCATVSALADFPMSVLWRSTFRITGELLGTEKTSVLVRNETFMKSEWVGCPRECELFLSEGISLWSCGRDLPAECQYQFQRVSADLSCLK